MQKTRCDYQVRLVTFDLCLEAKPHPLSLVTKMHIEIVICFFFIQSENDCWGEFYIATELVRKTVT